MDRGRYEYPSDTRLPLFLEQISSESLLDPEGMSSLSLIDRETEQPAPVPVVLPHWTELALITGPTKIPEAVMNLFRAQSDRNTITRFIYVTTFANLCMVESGFVPVFPGAPEIPVSELMAMNRADRMCRMVDILTSIYRQRHIMDVVQYKYIVEVPQEGAAADGHDVPNLAYGSSLITLTTSHNIDTYLHMSTSDHRVTFKLNVLGTYVDSITNWERHTLEDMMILFSTQRFIHDVKAKLCAHFVDHLDTYDGNIRGIRILPNEVILHLAKFLDMRSFVKLMISSRRHVHLLDTEEWWGKLLRRIPFDFPKYRLIPPSAEVLRSTIAEVGPTNKEKYKRLYHQAIRQRQARGFPLGPRRQGPPQMYPLPPWNLNPRRFPYRL